MNGFFLIPRSDATPIDANVALAASYSAVITEIAGAGVVVVAGIVILASTDVSIRSTCKGAVIDPAAISTCAKTFN